MTKASQFLKSRAEILKTALEFFLYSGHNLPLNEKLLIFLSQLDFWDFEIESLIYVFEDFKKRSLSWQGGTVNLENKIRSQGIVVKNNAVDSIKESRRNRTSYSNSDTVIADFTDLNETIKIWNSIIKSCEKLILPEKLAEISGFKSKNILSFIKEEKHESK